MDYEKIVEIQVSTGRYFSAEEVVNGSNVAVLGHNIAMTLFASNQSSVGKYIKIKGINFKVIASMPRAGKDFLNLQSADDKIIIPYLAFRKLFLTGTGSSSEVPSKIIVKGDSYEEGLEGLENDLRGLLRRSRGLRPGVKDNFSINRPEVLANSMNNTFNALRLAGWIIGSFSMLIGGFGIANIMFVIVKRAYRHNRATKGIRC